MKNKFGFSTYHEIIIVELRHAIRRYFDLWEDILDREEGHGWFIGDIEARRISVIVLSSALVEYVANFFLCIKCDSKQFDKLDKKPLAEKWKAIPKQFNPAYCLESGLENDLKQLIARRKSIVHAKPMISIDDDGRHKGNLPEVELDEHDFIGRCTTLPYKLVKNLLNYFPEIYSELSSIEIYIGIAADEFQKGQQRIMIASKYPRELIREIMQQGFDRQTAVTCAIFIMDRRETDAEGNITVRCGRIIKLKPLKFFANEKIISPDSSSAVGATSS
jgi:hypothetical protein